MSGVDAGLADPADLQRNQRAKEFFGLIHVRRNVVVDEKNQGLLYAADFIDNLVHGAASLRISKVGLDGAEFAAEMASSPGLHQPDRQVTLSREDRSVRTKAAQLWTLRL